MHSARSNGGTDGPGAVLGERLQTAQLPRHRRHRGKRAMTESDALATARDMLRTHGLRAQAVAMERIEEARRQGDFTGLHRWEQTHAAICELRRTAPHPHPSQS